MASGLVSIQNCFLAPGKSQITHGHVWLVRTTLKSLIFPQTSKVSHQSNVISVLRNSFKALPNKWEFPSRHWSVSFWVTEQSLIAIKILWYIKFQYSNPWIFPTKWRKLCKIYSLCVSVSRARWCKKLWIDADKIFHTNSNWDGEYLTSKVSRLWYGYQTQIKPVSWCRGRMHCFWWNFLMDSFYVCKGQSALDQIKNQSTTTFSYHLFSRDYSNQQCQCSDTVGWATGRTSGL